MNAGIAAGGGVGAGGAELGGTEPGGTGPGAETGGPEPGGAELGGTGFGDVEPGGREPAGRVGGGVLGVVVGGAVVGGATVVVLVETAGLEGATGEVPTGVRPYAAVGATSVATATATKTRPRRADPNIALPVGIRAIDLQASLRFPPSIVWNPPKSLSSYWLSCSLLRRRSINLGLINFSALGSTGDLYRYEARREGPAPVRQECFS